MKKKLNDAESFYTFIVESKISMNVKVKAKTIEEAIEKAQECSVQSLCHQCSLGDYEDEWHTSGELDCDPASSELVDLYVGDEWVQGTEFESVKKLWG